LLSVNSSLFLFLPFYSVKRIGYILGITCKKVKKDRGEKKKEKKKRGIDL